MDKKKLYNCTYRESREDDVESLDKEARNESMKICAERNN